MWFHSRIKKLLSKNIGEVYTNTFENTVSGRDVLDDLAHFCEMDKSGMRPSPEETAYAAGKREVFLYILKKLERRSVNFLKGDKND